MCVAVRVIISNDIKFALYLEIEGVKSLQSGEEQNPSCWGVERFPSQTRAPTRFPLQTSFMEILLLLSRMSWYRPTPQKTRTCFNKQSGSTLEQLCYFHWHFAVSLLSFWEKKCFLWTTVHSCFGFCPAGLIFANTFNTLFFCYAA